MKLIMLPLFFSIACIAYQNRDRIIDQYDAAYPSDPAKQAALTQCVAANPNFNRLDADDRQSCYHKNFGSTPVAFAPTPSAYYAYSPSHLAGSDIRRQEANAAYRLPALIAKAEAAPAPLPAVHQPPHLAAHHATPAHHATARNRTLAAWQTR